MTDEEMIEEQNAYYMAGYPSRRSENKMDKDEREKQIQIDAEQIRALQKQNGELTDKVKELEAQKEKLIDFVLSKTECCDVCPIDDTCINSEGTCPYAGILAKGEEEVTREWLMQKIAKEIKEK